MKPSLLLCIPGPWPGRAQFADQVSESTHAEFLYAGGLLSRPIANQEVRLEFAPRDPGLRASFEVAGGGLLSEATLTAIDAHQSIAVLAFEDLLLEEREKIGDFSNRLRLLGGAAVRVESSGVAHEWDKWLELITSDNPVDWYRSVVGLIRDEDEKCYCSCGMHHFGLLDVQAPALMEQEPAADLINQFNVFQIVRRTVQKGGRPFSLTSDAANYRIKAVRDHRHVPEDMLHNPHGLWRFAAA
ncbi:MAG: hypothetical protein JSR82_20935 [Verrucomicrobia bacterium]|nr:hypothetical protein [Verrucomicrobiota bacterium]